MTEDHLEASRAFVEKRPAGLQGQVSTRGSLEPLRHPTFAVLADISRK
jgi:hypothetical protein